MDVHCIICIPSVHLFLLDNVCYLRTRAPQVSRLLNYDAALLMLQSFPLPWYNLCAFIPQEVRVGVIVAGGLFGMMLGFRRGVIYLLLIRNK